MENLTKIKQIRQNNKVDTQPKKINLYSPLPFN